MRIWCLWMHSKIRLFVTLLQKSTIKTKVRLGEMATGRLGVSFLSKAELTLIIKLFSYPICN